MYLSLQYCFFICCLFVFVSIWKLLFLYVKLSPDLVHACQHFLGISIFLVLAQEDGILIFIFWHFHLQSSMDSFSPPFSGAFISFTAHFMCTQSPYKKSVMRMADLLYNIFINWVNKLRAEQLVIFSLKIASMLFWFQKALSGAQ